MIQKLSTKDHSRDVVNLTYVYPVISRRAGGLSIGINVNTNNACNWRCVYCQVPELVRGSAPEIDRGLLEKELRLFLEQVLFGDFYEKFNIPQKQRVIKDISISGNGEPTSVEGLDKVIELVAGVATEYKVLPGCDFVLITNGSLMHKQGVRAGLRVLNKFNGKVWFKLDSATNEGRKKINDSSQSTEKILKNLIVSTELCKTSLQTCLLQYLHKEDVDRELGAYVGFLKENQIKLQKIMLYTIARPSLQPEADLISPVSESVMNRFSSELRKLGYDVSVSM